jgi:hypothetical protein
MPGIAAAPGSAGHLCRGYETGLAGASISYAVIRIFAPNSSHHGLTVEIEHGSLSDQRR